MRPPHSVGSGWVVCLFSGNSQWARDTFTLACSFIQSSTFVDGWKNDPPSFANPQQLTRTLALCHSYRINCEGILMRMLFLRLSLRVKAMALCKEWVTEIYTWRQVYFGTTHVCDSCVLPVKEEETLHINSCWPRYAQSDDTPRKPSSRWFLSVGQQQRDSRGITSWIRIFMSFI